MAHQFVVPASLLKAIVTSAASMAASDDRGVISGILVDVSDEGTLSITSTDGYRLYHRSIGSRAGDILPGSFPNFRQIMPESYKHTVTVDRLALLAATKAMPGKDVDGNAMTLTMNGKTEIRGTDKSGNQLAQSLPCDHVGDDPEITITFNASYLADVLKALAADAPGKKSSVLDEVTIELNGPVQAATFRAGNRDNSAPNHRAVLLMPIRA